METAGCSSKTDTHFSGSGLGLVADTLSEKIKKADWYAGVTKKEYMRKAGELSINGDLSAMQKTDALENVLQTLIRS